MGTATELDKLVVRLVGDNSGYTKTMKDSVKLTQTGAKQISGAQKAVMQEQNKLLQQNGIRFNAAGRAINEYGKFVKVAEFKVNSFNATLKHMTMQALASGKAVRSVGTKMTLGMTLPLVGAGVGALKLAGDLEQTRLQFGVMLRDAKKGDALLGNLREFAATTPFRFGKVTGAAKTLLAFGVEQEKLSGTMRMVGDVAAGTGKDFQELAVIYGQIRGMGRLQGQDFLQLVNAGFPVIEIAKTMGISMEQLKKKMEEGKVPFSVVEATFKRLTKEGGVFGNMMDKLSKTALGRLSTLLDNVGMLLADLGNIMLPVFSDIIEYLMTWTKWAQKLNPVIKTTIVVVGMLAAAMGPVLIMLGMLISAISGIVTVLGAVTVAGVVFAAKLLAIVAAAAAVVAGLAALVVAIFGTDEVLAAFGRTWDWVKTKAQNFFHFVMGFMANFKHNIKALTTWLAGNWHNVLKDMGRMWVALNINAVKNVGVMLNTMWRLWVAVQGALIGLWKKIFSGDFVKAAWAGIVKVMGIFLDFADNVTAAVKSAFTGEKVDVSGFMERAFDDLRGGEEDFFGTVKNILKDGASDLHNPLEGFKSSIQEGPKLALQYGKEIKENLNKELDAVSAKKPVQEIKELTKEQKKLAKDITDFTGGMQQTIATWGMTSREIEIWRLQTRGATKDQVALMRALDKQLTGMEKQKKLMAKGADLTKQMRSPLEVFTDRQKELQEMLSGGAISVGVFTKAMDEAKKQLDKEYKVDMKVGGVEGVQAGTAEAIARLQEYAGLRPGAGNGLLGGPTGATVAAAQPAVATAQPNAVLAAKQSKAATGGSTSHEGRVETLLARIAVGVENDEGGITLEEAGL